MSQKHTVLAGTAIIFNCTNNFLHEEIPVSAVRVVLFFVPNLNIFLSRADTSQEVIPHNWGFKNSLVKWELLYEK